MKVAFFFSYSEGSAGFSPLTTVPFRAGSASLTGLGGSEVLSLAVEELARRWWDPFPLPLPLPFPLPLPLPLRCWNLTPFCLGMVLLCAQREGGAEGKSFGDSRSPVHRNWNMRRRRSKNEDGKGGRIDTCLIAGCLSPSRKEDVGLAAARVSLRSRRGTCLLSAEDAVREIVVSINRDRKRSARKTDERRSHKSRVELRTLPRLTE